MKKTLIYTAVLGALLSSPAMASLNGCAVTDASEFKTSVYFSNGVGTSYDDAAAMSLEIRIAYKDEFDTLQENANYSFETAYNYTQGKFTDVIQVLQQKLIEEGVDNNGLSAYQLYELSASMLSNDEIRAFLAIYLSGVVIAELYTDELLEEISVAMTEAIANAITDRARVESEHIELYERALAAGTRVLIMAHSQGNLFTNTAVDAVRQRQPDYANSIDAFGIATPAARTVNDGSDYITADDDRVIDLIRSISDVLPGNLDNDIAIFPIDDSREASNHYLYESYWNPVLPSRAEINKNMIRLATDTPFPVQVAGVGAIRATLSWDGMTDVDLHAFEPDGNQVYYSDKVGIGILDVDNTRGLGPENYTVACNDVVEGQYQIGVNFYSGNGPENAKVAITLGGQREVTPRSITLLSSEGTAGNSNPEIIFTVTVTDDGEGNAVYSVE